MTSLLYRGFFAPHSHAEALSCLLLNPSKTSPSCPHLFVLLWIWED